MLDFCAEAINAALRRSSPFTIDHLFGFIDQGLHGLISVGLRVSTMLLKDRFESLLLDQRLLSMMH
jgi:hypothetical protein